jgi:predicted outer membrane repeat protein
MKDKSGDNSITAINPLLIDLPDGIEQVPSGFTLTQGSNSPAAVVIDGHGRTLELEDGGGSIITVGSGVTLALRNITLQGRASNTASLVQVNGGTLKLESGAVIKGNVTSAPGGGVAVSGGGTLRIESGAVIRENTSLADGGGVYVGTDTMSGTLIMKGGTITANTADNSGGGVALYNSSVSSEISGGTISDNLAGLDGGGIWVDEVANLTISNIVIRNNAATGNGTSLQRNGGGMYVRKTEVTMKDCFVTGNTAKNDGGGIRVELGTFTMENGIITKNTTNSTSGGISVSGTYFTMENGEISSNKASIGNTNGVYLMSSSGHASIFKMLGSARVASDDNVFIANGSAIEVLSGQLSTTGLAANIKGTLSSGTMILTGTGVSQYRNKFLYNDSTLTIDGKTP